MFSALVRAVTAARSPDPAQAGAQRRRLRDRLPAGAAGSLRPRRVILIAGLLAATVCAVIGIAIVLADDGPDASQYAPTPRSRLVTRADLVFKLAQVQEKDRRVTVLGLEAEPGSPEPVARMTFYRVNRTNHFDLHLPPARRASPQAVVVRIAALEHLYAWTMRQDATGVFCMSEGKAGCSAERAGQDHGAVLAQIAAARQRLLDEASGLAGYAAWHPVTLRLLEPGTDPDQVTVEVTLDGAPLADAPLYVSRPPHSTCKARSGADGIASCRLEDPYGANHFHPIDEIGQVLATYPGDVQAQKVSLPGTAVMRAGR